MQKFTDMAGNTLMSRTQVGQTMDQAPHLPCITFIKTPTSQDAPMGSKPSDWEHNNPGACYADKLDSDADDTNRNFAECAWGLRARMLSYILSWGEKSPGPAFPAHQAVVQSCSRKSRQQSGSVGQVLGSHRTEARQIMRETHESWRSTSVLTGPLLWRPAAWSMPYTPS